jgi:Phosphotransferase enzyme family
MNPLAANTLLGMAAASDDPQFPAPTSRPWLELLHPDGVAGRVLVLGSNTPESWQPATEQQADLAVDLAILAPTKIECCTAGWLPRAAQLLARQLHDDGVAYVIAPLPWRFALARELSRCGLIVTTAFVHLPDWAKSDDLVPLSPGPARYAIRELAIVRPWKQPLALLGLRVPRALDWLGGLLPSIGLVARRPGARPLFAWLANWGAEGFTPSTALIRSNGRRSHRSCVVFSFSGSAERPVWLAKLTLGAPGGDLAANEATTLARLGPAACASGARLPRVMREGDLGERRVCVQTVVSGRPAAQVLMSQPSRLGEIMNRVADWLKRWHASTRTIRPLRPEEFPQHFLRPAARLVPLLPRGRAYWGWLEQRCAKLAGTPVPMVATHNDLTMWNLLIGRDRQLGIVDWEAGREQGLPLADFLYATVDAAAAMRGYADRLRAYQDCFTAGGRYVRAVSQWQTELRQVTGISVDWAELCLHGCWLQHALDELQSQPASASQPFLSIVRWLSERALEATGR